MAERDPLRQIRPLEIEGAPVPSLAELWPLKDKTGAAAGVVSSAAWSPDFQTNVAIAMVNRDHWQAGSELLVVAPDGARAVRVREKFWI